MIILLVCTFIFIETFFCLYAKVKLLRNSFASVQYEYYSVPPLLRCNHLLTCRKTLIDTISCLCATRWLLNISYCLCAIIGLSSQDFAHVQLHGYWGMILLVCSGQLINSLDCLRAGQPLLNLFLARVHSRAYWEHVLLGCTLPIIDT